MYFEIEPDLRKQTDMPLHIIGEIFLFMSQTDERYKCRNYQK